MARLASVAPLLAWLCLAAASAPAQAQNAAAAAIRYDVEIEGLDAIGLTKQARQLSRLVNEKGQPPSSRAGLSRRVRGDVETLRRLLRAEGYYGAQVFSDIAAADDGGKIDVRLKIDPGQRFQFAPPEIQFTPPIAAEHRDALLNALPLAAGAPARHEAILAAERLLLGRLPQIGHPFADIADRRFIADHAEGTVRIGLDIDAGPKVHYGKLRFEGLEKVSPGLLERMAPWQPGAAYDQRQIDDYRAELYGSGLFSSVSVNPVRPNGETAGQEQIDATIQVQVREALHRTVGFGAGYATSEGFSLEASWTHRNILGSGEELTLLARAATLEQSLNAEFAKPAFFRRDQVLRADISLKREDTDAFSSHGVEAGAAIERRLGRHWVASLGGRAEWVRTNDNLSRITDNLNQGKERFILGALPASLRFDNTDDVLDPRRGARAALIVTPEAGLQDGAFAYARTELTASGYYPLGERQWTVLAARMKIGSVLFSDTDRLPASRRFFAGGGGSIRGFGYQDVGPLDPQGDPLGGRSVVEFGFETRLRITETIGLVPFIEGGNVYSQSAPKFSGLRWGAGLGGRYYTSFAPIRLDIGVPINPRPGDNDFQVYISIGQSF
ncbi:MAG: autotransporter assembly complex family protein [Sphingomonadales bacterium]